MSTHETNGRYVRTGWLLGVLVGIVILLGGSWAQSMDHRVERIENKVDELLMRSK